MAKNQNKNKNNIVQKEPTECQGADENNTLAKYLYDKEIERSKIIVDKTTAAFFLFAVGNGFISVNWAELYTNDIISVVFLCIMLVFIIIAVVFLVLTFGFTTKINTSGCENSKTNIYDYYSYLHNMNDKKEEFIRISYISLTISVCTLIILGFRSQL